MNNTESANIYIPDISGFSNFVNEIEILHGQEITGELLEEIIDSNEIGLEVSEIEGDAVLFFKIGEPVPVNQIYEQSLNILKRFNRKKEEIQEKRICICNACSSVKSLKLKFILHYDSIKIMNIKNFKKLFGKGIIIAHRLLKNNIKENEYLIFTREYFDKVKEKNNYEFLNIPSKQVLESFGEIDCLYIILEAKTKNEKTY